MEMGGVFPVYLRARRMRRAYSASCPHAAAPHAQLAWPAPAFHTSLGSPFTAARPQLGSHPGMFSALASTF